jgi:hypothetical protein
LRFAVHAVRFIGTLRGGLALQFGFARLILVGRLGGVWKLRSPASTLELLLPEWENWRVKQPFACARYQDLFEDVLQAAFPCGRAGRCEFPFCKLQCVLVFRAQKTAINFQKLFESRRQVRSRHSQAR